MKLKCHKHHNNNNDVKKKKCMSDREWNKIVSTLSESSGRKVHKDGTMSSWWWSLWCMKEEEVREKRWIFVDWKQKKRRNRKEENSWLECWNDLIEKMNVKEEKDISF